MKLLTVLEVGQILRISKNSVRKLVRRGRLKAIRFGRAFKIKQQDLEEFISKSENRVSDDSEAISLLQHSRVCRTRDSENEEVSNGHR
jgi:excisionase family DNA binding protein